MKEAFLCKLRRLLRQLLCRHEWVDSPNPPHIANGYKYQEQFCSKCLKRRVDMR